MASFTRIGYICTKTLDKYVLKGCIKLASREWYSRYVGQIGVKGMIIQVLYVFKDSDSECKIANARKASHKNRQH